jgi:hypothetical protein
MIAAVALVVAIAGESPRVSAGEPGTAARKLAPGAVIRVGPGRELARPSAAAKIARDGDVIEIDAGNYDGDAASWTQNGLTIRGVGGRAHLRAAGAHAEGKAIWVIKGANTTIENVEFSGAVVGDGNGAGIRQEGAGLIVRNSFFHHNQNGILAGRNDASDIVIEHSEFASNGNGEGNTHNIYIGEVRSFTLRYSSVHHAVVGHDVKSRALTNHIAYNRIMDENDGRSSYAIDLSNGGLGFVIQMKEGNLTVVKVLPDVLIVRGGQDDATAYSRLLSAGGIEDPATGSAAGPAGSFAAKYGLAPSGGAAIVFLQGALVRRPSRLHVRVGASGGEITSVKVGGSSVVVGEGTMTP